MRTKYLPRYMGRLTPAEIAYGINIARDNAKRLAADAQTLFDLGRFPSAFALAALAIEEAGKDRILRGLSTAKSDDEAKKAWREYRSHRSKNGMWIVPEMYMSGARHLRDFYATVDSNAEHAAMLDALKQAAVYTDCLGDRHWAVPDEAINQEITKSLVWTANILTKRDDCSAREMELWVELVAPHEDLRAMVEGLIRWHEAMLKEGLTKHSIEEASDFILGLGSSNDPPDAEQLVG